MGSRYTEIELKTRRARGGPDQPRPPDIKQLIFLPPIQGSQKPDA